MRDLRTSITAIQRLCTDVGQITLMIDEMLTCLQQTLDGLGELDDRHARNAEAEIRVAQAALRQARAVWFADYVRRSEDLCHQIAS